MTNQMVKGNTAVIIGAMYAGCDCFFGYPITPASEILHEASKYFPMVNRNFVQEGFQFHQKQYLLKTLMIQLN